MLREITNTALFDLSSELSLATAARREQMSNEQLAVARFAARVNAISSLSQASWALQARLLEEVRIVARHIDAGGEKGKASGYDRRVLYEDPSRWSLAAIIMRPGQKTERHDHGGWGCAVTVQGVERDRRFVKVLSIDREEPDDLVLDFERNYPPFTGYIFDPKDVHQPLGADPQGVTVALHFLVHEGAHHNANPEIVFAPVQLEKAA